MKYIIHLVIFLLFTSLRTVESAPIESTIVGLLESSNSNYQAALAGTFVYDANDLSVSAVDIEIFDGNSSLYFTQGIQRSSSYGATVFRFAQPLSNQYNSYLLHLGIFAKRGDPLDLVYEIVDSGSQTSRANVGIEICRTIDCILYDSVRGTYINGVSGFVSSVTSHVDIYEQEGEYIFVAARDDSVEVILDDMKDKMADARDLAQYGQYIPANHHLSPEQVDQIEESVSNRTVDFVSTIQYIYTSVRSLAGTAAQYIAAAAKGLTYAAEVMFTNWVDDPPRDDYQNFDYYTDMKFDSGFADLYGSRYSVLDRAFTNYASGIEAYELALLAFERAQGAALANDLVWMEAQLTSTEMLFSIAQDSFGKAESLFNESTLTLSELDELTLEYLDLMSAVSGDFQPLDILQQASNSQEPAPNIANVTAPTSSLLCVFALALLILSRGMRSKIRYSFLPKRICS